MNKEIVVGFDEEKETSLSIRLEKVEQVPGCLFVHLGGYIDLANHRYFQKKLAMVVAAGFTRLILDMSEISFVGSVGVGGIASLQKTLRQKSGDMVIQQLQPKVCDVFDLLGLARFFTTTRGPEESLAHFTRKPATPVVPRVFACPTCAARLRAGRAGRYRCP